MSPNSRKYNDLHQSLHLYSLISSHYTKKKKYIYIYIYIHQEGKKKIINKKRTNL